VWHHAHPAREPAEHHRESAAEPGARASLPKPVTRACRVARAGAPYAHLGAAALAPVGAAAPGRARSSAGDLAPAPSGAAFSSPFAAAAASGVGVAAPPGSPAAAGTPAAPRLPRARSAPTLFDAHAMRVDAAWPGCAAAEAGSHALGSTSPSPSCSSEDGAPADPEPTPHPARLSAGLRLAAALAASLRLLQGARSPRQGARRACPGTPPAPRRAPSDGAAAVDGAVADAWAGGGDTCPRRSDSLPADRADDVGGDASGADAGAAELHRAVAAMWCGTQGLVQGLRQT